MTLYDNTKKITDIEIEENHSGIEKPKTTEKKNVNETNNWIIAFAITAFILLVAIITCDSKNNKITSLETDLYHANINYSNLAESNKIYVHSLTVGNAKNATTWITGPGAQLHSERVRYINPIMWYTTELTDKITIYVKIINANGYVIPDVGNTVPGYSYSVTKSPKKGDRVDMDLFGLGAPDKSIFSAGEYTVEVWYKNECLKSSKFIIYE
ncbi:MAG: hypothetical protein Ta2F_01780 [Termitinemataceae bacterium]|nr:MAG: hypothetical protein Ta2F_01780 [Termitinemataceae bacterium]